VSVGCGDDRLFDERQMSDGYRTGTEADDYLSNGERGNLSVTEINWAGSVEQVDDGFVHHPDDVYIELQNKHFRPIHATGWQIQIYTGNGTYDGGSEHFATYIIPARANRQPIESNEYVVVTNRSDGSIVDPDYVIADFQLPRDHFSISIRDLDNRLIEFAGDAHQDIFAGAWDLVSVRSMERVQLIFSNQGGRQSTWHSYSLNEWDGALHRSLRSRLADAYQARTFGSPGGPNSPDYSGNTSSGSTD
jgi:hypothetical protein